VVSVIDHLCTKQEKSAVCIISSSFFFFTAVYITDNLCTKNGNSSFFKPKIRGLYTRAVTDQERVIMARVRYLGLKFAVNN
jgi:hypothetical protein